MSLGWLAARWGGSEPENRPNFNRRIRQSRAALLREIEAVRKVYRLTLAPGVAPGAESE
jgi:hypothetical protein